MGNKISEFEQALHKEFPAFPKSLDDIIKSHRDLVSVYLATETQLDELAGEIRAAGNSVKDEIEDWRFITVDVAGMGTKVMLLGHALRRKETWITSKVEGIDLEAGFVRTANSIYRLAGARGIGEPPLYHLLHVCHWFHRTAPDMAEMLGVMEVTY
jgi:hypothetical protein